jgi:Mechanosensitive ion channel
MYTLSFRNISLLSIVLFHLCMLLGIFYQKARSILTPLSFVLGAISCLFWHFYQKKLDLPVVMSILGKLYKVLCMVELNSLFSLTYVHKAKIRIYLSILVFTIFDILIFYIFKKLQSEFFGEDRYKYYRDIIALERYFIYARYLKYNMDEKYVIDSIKNTGNEWDTKTLFCLLTNNEDLRTKAQQFEALSILERHLNEFKEYYREHVAFEDSASTEDQSVAEDLTLNPLIIHLQNIQTSENISRNIANFSLTQTETDMSQNEMPNMESSNPNSDYNNINPQPNNLNFSKPELYIVVERINSIDQKRLMAIPFFKYHLLDMIGSVPMSRIKKLRKINKIGMSGTVDLDSIKAAIGRENAHSCHRILTQGLSESLDFSEFKDNLKQLNNERKNFISTLKNNDYIVEILRYIGLCLEIILNGAITTRIFKSNEFIKLAVLPFFIFALPVSLGLIDSFIFLLYIHPYDIGDRVYIEGDNLIVKDIRLTSTVFERWNNEVVVISNRYIQGRPIKNIRRSRNQQSKIEFYVSNKTPRASIDAIDEALLEFVQCDSAFESFNMYYDEIRDSSFCKLSFVIKHSINHQNGFFMWKVQNKFMKKLIEECAEKNISYVPLDQIIDKVN